MGRRKQQQAAPPPAIGHNGEPLGADDERKLRGYVQEIERLEDDGKEIRENIGLIYKSAKDGGFSVKAIRQIVRERKRTREEREALEATLDAYRQALGMIADLPLGQAAISRVAPADTSEPPFLPPAA